MYENSLNSNINMMNQMINIQRTNNNILSQIADLKKNITAIILK